MPLFNLTMIMSSFISLVFCSSPLVKEGFLTFVVKYLKVIFKTDLSYLKFSFGFIKSCFCPRTVVNSCFDLLFLIVLEVLLSSRICLSGAPNENIVQNHINIALLNVF